MARSRHRDLLRDLSRRAVIFNDLVIPAKSVSRVVTRYVDHLVEILPDPDWLISLAGSVTLIHYRDRFFGVCCRHQLQGRDPEAIALLEGAGRTLISSGGLSSFNNANEGDFHDLAAFDFTEPCKQGALQPSRFLPVRAVPPNVLADRIVFVACAGFPFRDQQYELDKRHLGSGKRIAVCLPDHQPSDPALIALKMYRPIDFDPDGMSGGSAIVCLENSGRLELHLAGIVTRGGAGHFYVLKTGYICSFLDAVIRQKLLAPACEIAN
ncbi:hypothetical protein [Bosea beijingensis]